MLFADVEVYFIKIVPSCILNTPAASASSVKSITVPEVTAIFSLTKETSTGSGAGSGSISGKVVASINSASVRGLSYTFAS